MGSILAHVGPVVPLSDKLYEKAKEVFASYNLAAAPEEAGAAAAGDNADPDVSAKPKSIPEFRIPYKKLASALYKCGVCPFDVDALEDPLPLSAEREDEGDAEKDVGGEDGEEEEKNSAPSERPVHPTKLRMARIIAQFSVDAELGPSQTLKEQDFLNFVSRFQAPAFQYGQRMRRAAGRGCTDDVLDLLLRGTDVNTADGEGLTSLHYATEFNRKDLIQAISDFAGDKLIVDARCKAGWSPLYTACHHNNIDVVRLLLALGAGTSVTTILGKTPLHAAAGQGFLPIVQVLLDAGADGKQQCSSGMTPMHDAAYKCQVDCYDLLSESEACDVKIKENLKYTAEQILHGATGTNTGGPMSYGGSTLAAASIARGDENSVTGRGEEDGENC